MSRKSVQRFCDDDMRKFKDLKHVAQSVQRFCDDGVRKNNRLKLFGGKGKGWKRKSHPPWGGWPFLKCGPDYWQT